MEVLTSVYLQNIEEKFGVPLYAVHRVDFHNQLKELAIQNHGLGVPVDV